MKKSIIYKFPKNGAFVKLSYQNITLKRAKEDCLWLEWHTQEGNRRGIGMRPDEALLIAEMLCEGVRRITVAYETDKPIKGYRIKKA